jgi:hypothetical protein
MKGYAVWNNTTKQWYGNGKRWTKGLPKIHSLRKNAVARKKDLLYWQKRYALPAPDIRIVELDIVPVNTNHLI